MPKLTRKSVMDDTGCHGGLEASYEAQRDPGIAHEERAWMCNFLLFSNARRGQIE